MTTELCQLFKMERFLQKCLQLLTVFTKCSILDIWQGSEYASGDRQNIVVGYSFLMISGIEVNQLTQIRLILEAKLGKDPLLFSILKFERKD